MMRLLQNVSLVCLLSSSLSNAFYTPASTSTTSTTRIISRSKIQMDRIQQLYRQTSTSSTCRQRGGHNKHIASISSSSSSSLHVIPLPLDLGMEDLIYQAQSTASRLASTSITSLSSSSLSKTSLSSLAVLYFAGLLTSFSPCSLGLLPLTVSYISNAAGEREDKAAFLPTLFFALGLAFVFCGLGLSVALLGGVFGSSGAGTGGGGGATSIGSILLATLSSGVSIAMGLQLLELVNLPLPSLEIGSFSTNGSGNGNGNGNINCSDGVCTQISYNDDGNVIESQSSGSSSAVIQGTATTAAISTSTSTISSTNTSTSTSGTGGAASALFRTFLLGGSSALVASPCATPVLTSILAFVAASRDPALGAVLLFIYTVGYSTPLLLIGASGGQALANAQAAAAAASEDGGDGEGNGSLLANIGSFVNPLTASVLIWYGTNGFLQAVLGDPSYFALNPVLDY